jgi:hypothetical protein
MVDFTKIVLDVSVADDGEYTVFVQCTDCGSRVSLWPDEGVVTQLQAFLGVHQHE